MQLFAESTDVCRPNMYLCTCGVCCYSQVSLWFVVGIVTCKNLAKTTILWALWFVSQRFVCCRFGPQYGDQGTVEPLRGRAWGWGCGSRTYPANPSPAVQTVVLQKEKEKKKRWSQDAYKKHTFGTFE
jgi:hypothetical protein